MVHDMLIEEGLTSPTTASSPQTGIEFSGNANNREGSEEQDHKDPSPRYQDAKACELYQVIRNEQTAQIE